jgi:hypothetical protein
MKINFKLPNTSLCVVIHFRDDKKGETLIPTPRDNEALRSEMLKRKVGYGEIRGVKSVDTGEIANYMSRV